MKVFSCLGVGRSRSRRRSSTGTAVLAVAAAIAAGGNPAIAQAGSTDLIVGPICAVGGLSTPLTFACAAYAAYQKLQRRVIALPIVTSCGNSYIMPYKWHLFRRTYANGVTRRDLDSLVGLRAFGVADAPRRVSGNIDRTLFGNSRAGKWVYVHYIDVQAADRVVELQFWADKPGLPNHPRSERFRHGQWVWVTKGNTNDCWYYLVVPETGVREEFLRRNPHAKVLLIMDAPGGHGQGTGRRSRLR